MTITFVIHYFMGAILYPFINFLYFGVILTPKYTRKPNWFYAVMATILIQPVNLGRMADENSVIFDLVGLIQLVYMIGFVFLMFREKIWEKLLMAVLWAVTANVAGVILAAGIGDIIQEIDFTGDDPVAMVYEIVLYIITFSVLGLIGVAWKMLKKMNIPKNIWIFLLFPVSQFLMVCNLPMDTYRGEVNLANPWYMIFSLLIGIIADVILFYVMFTQGEKDRIKQQLEETEKLMEMEKGHFETIELHLEEMRKMRHDFGNQLTVALSIAQSGEPYKSVELLEQLRGKLENDSREKWCEHPVLNAVISEKSRVCTREKIAFTAQLDVSGEIGILPLHLCSVLTNLLDNAISAAVESSEENMQVTLHAKQQERYLFIKVENTAKKPEKKEKRPGHGYGLQIIRSITEQYNGSYKGTWDDGVYTAVVMMETK